LQSGQIFPFENMVTSESIAQQTKFKFWERISLGLFPDFVWTCAQNGNVIFVRGKRISPCSDGSAWRSV